MCVGSEWACECASCRSGAQLCSLRVVAQDSLPYSFTAAAACPRSAGDRPWHPAKALLLHLEHLAPVLDPRCILRKPLTKKFHREREACERGCHTAFSEVV